MELEQEKYLTLLAEKYPTVQTVCREIGRASCRERVSINV